MKTAGLLLFAALSVLAIAGVLVGLLTHTEAGLVRVCADGAAVIRYAPPARCALTTELRWHESQFPLAISVSGNALAVERAMDDVNAQLGFAAFSFVGEPASVIVTLDVPYERGWLEAAGAVSHTRTGAGLRADVLVGNVPEAATLHVVLVHELGHVLGLAHDDFEASAMFPVATRARFTDPDRMLLRHIYRSRS